MSRERKAVLAHWLGQKKTTVREREEAKEDLDLWLKRTKLAIDAREVDMARAAKERAVEAREKYRAATARLIEIESELEKVRSEKWIPNQDEADAARQRAEHTAREFQKLGVDARFDALGDPRDVALDAPTDPLADTLETFESPAASPSLAGSTTPIPRSALDEADALLDDLSDLDEPPEDAP